MSGDLSDPVGAITELLMARDYEPALAIATGMPSDHPESDAMRRVVFARMGRFAEAAEAGWRHLARPTASLEDRFRLAQILTRCGDYRNAFTVGMGAIERAPEDWRLLIPVIEAVLAEPALEAELRDAAAPIVALHPRCRPPSAAPAGALRVPTLLPHYDHLEGRHSIFTSFVRSIRGVELYWPDSYGSGLVAAALEELPRAQAAVVGFLDADPEIDRASAARYVAARFPTLLVDDAGCAADMLQHAPVTLAELPFFFSYDAPHCLFQPFCPTEDMVLPADAPGIYRIIRHQLESPKCLGIVTLYEDAGRRLGVIFDSDIIRDKCVFANPPSSPDLTIQHGRGSPVAVRGQGETVTLFVPTSADARTEIFYLRGGVDILNAFAELSAGLPFLRLILRGPLPPGLSTQLRQLVQTHPAIRWLPDYLSSAEYEQILRHADVMLLPSVATFRNGLVQAMGWGMVPVTSDAYYNAEIVQDGVSGVVVPGRARLAYETEVPAGFVADWCEIYRARDEPSDPDFFAAFKASLRALVTDRAMIARISSYNLRTPSRHLASEESIARLSALFEKGLRLPDVARARPVRHI